MREKAIKRLKQKAGERVLDLDMLKTAAKLRPTEPGTFEP